MTSRREPDPLPATGGHAPGELPALAPTALSDYQAASELLRALSAPVRLAIVDLLTAGPRCVHELVEAVGVSQPLVSQHLKTLRGVGMVTTQRRGREMVYRLADDHVAHMATDALLHARERTGPASGGAQLAPDRARRR